MTNLVATELERAATTLLDDGRDKIIKELLDDKVLVSRSWWTSQRGRFWLFVLALMGCAGGSGVYQWWLSTIASPSSLLPNGANLATALIAATSALFAFYQWIDSRREGSLEEFYSRVQLLNERYYEWPEARELVSQFWAGALDEPQIKEALYVYLELDNLEYMIFRYQHGFVHKLLFRRALRAFASRCQSNRFSELAAKLVVGTGYDPATLAVVNILVAGARHLSESTR